MFIGRKKELKELIEKLNNDRFVSILLYGRRRIGKTKLIKEAAKSFNGTYIYYECKRGLLVDNLNAFNDEINRVFKSNFRFDSFKNALNFIFDYSKENLTLLAIDEFPYLVESHPAIVSNVRDLIDAYNMHSKMKFILSGSYVQAMKSLNDGESETLGRFTSIIPLETFDYFDSAKFYPNYSEEDKILMYSIFGGVAFFNRLIDGSKSPLENIKKLLIDKHSILQLEVENTILSETNKASLANSVVNLIGSGVNKYSDIVNRLTSGNKEKINPDYILKKLIDMEIIEKVSPINDQSNKKKTFYCFKDNLMEFYFRYIYANKNANSILSADDFYEIFIKDDLFAKYLPYKFEQISKEFLIRANKAHRISPLFYEIGTYSYKDQNNKINRQFDLVTKDKSGYISYECKFKDRPINKSIITEEEYQIISSGIDVYKLGFISKNGFEDNIDKEKYNLFSLKDFYDFDDWICTMK